MTSGLTGSSVQSASFEPKVAGVYNLVMSASCSSGMNKDSVNVTIGDNGWIRLRPQDCTYTLDGASLTTASWADTGSHTTVALNEDPTSGADITKPSQCSIRGIDTGILCQNLFNLEFIFEPTGTIPDILEQFVAGWMYGPQSSPVDADQAGGYTLLEVCNSGDTERYMIKKLTGDTGGEQTFGWTSTSATGYQRYHLNIALRPGDSTRGGQMGRSWLNVTDIAETKVKSQYINISDTGENVAGITMKVGMIAGRMEGATDSQNEFDAKWYYRLNYNPTASLNTI